MPAVTSSSPVIDQPLVADAFLRQTARIRRVGRRRQGRPEELARLTGAQLELVKLVRRSPGVSVARAAAELGLAANTVSTLVRRLTEAGMLVRTADPADRRIARLELPEKLARRVGAYRDRRLMALSAAIATLEPDEQATIAAATALLGRVADELERGAI
jgi:DNA-binding MarR family transcriptional regulator